MARPRSTLNRFADGLLKILQDDAQMNPETWFRVPRTFRRGVAPEIQQQAEPVLCVSLNGEGEPIPGPMERGAMSYRFTASIAVLFHGIGAEEAVGEMWDDIRRVINLNRQLSGVDDPDNPTILSGFMRIGTWNIAARDGSEGEYALEVQVVIQNSLMDSA